MIEVRGLKKSFEKLYVLDGLDMNVNKGSIYGLVGPNGAGKTTLIKNMVGIYKPDAGQIKINGEDVYENVDIKQRIAYMPDENTSFKNYSIKDMAKFYKGIYINWSSEKYEKVKAVLGLDEKIKIDKLSKGMKKQAMFLLLLSTMPELMLLDEPVDGLDPMVRKKIWNIIIEDVVEREMTVVISSHNLRELEDFCDTIGIMKGKKIVIEKELDELRSVITKIQVAFDNEASREELLAKDYILAKETKGNMDILIVRGSQDEIRNEIEATKPKLFDIMPLTLEEIFIYEMEEAGYEKNELIV
ncbi:MAG: ABC transporter [Clostridiales bacterium GWE2_32_10]|nr:MAG: ABC transporter [Clostridiales bacterium GWE2_32_10]HBY20657.1 ABC transporter [Clostridiales bacterium]